MEPSNPFAPPQAPTLVADVKPLGSLAQSARGKELKQARGTLIFVGLLTLAFNGFLVYNVPAEIAEAVRVNAVQPGQVEEFTRIVARFCYLVYGGTMALGLVFIVLGLLVQKYPVAMTVLGVVLYIGSAIFFAVLNPMTLAQGAIIKVIIVVSLIRAVRAALAYRADTRAALAEVAVS